jgi:hypothetical protein
VVSKNFRHYHLHSRIVLEISQLLISAYTRTGWEAAAGEHGDASACHSDTHSLVGRTTNHPSLTNHFLQGSPGSPASAIDVNSTHPSRHGTRGCPRLNDPRQFNDRATVYGCRPYHYATNLPLVGSLDSSRINDLSAPSLSTHVQIPFWPFMINHSIHGSPVMISIPFSPRFPKEMDDFATGMGIRKQMCHLPSVLAKWGPPEPLPTGVMGAAPWGMVE